MKRIAHGLVWYVALCYSAVGMIVAAGLPAVPTSLLHLTAVQAAPLFPWVALFQLGFLGLVFAGEPFLLVAFIVPMAMLVVLAFRRKVPCLVVIVVSSPTLAVAALVVHSAHFEAPQRIFW